MENHKPLFTIVTCTYNAEEFLEQALESIERQTLTDFEHVFNDGFSTDRTLEIIEDYTKRNKDRYPIKFMQSEPKGVGNALNVATTKAEGKIIQYLHSDDYYVSDDALERVAAYFIDNPDLVWLTGNYLLEVKGKQFIIPQTFLLKTNIKKVLSVMNIIHHENTFVQTDAVKKYGGFDEAYPGCEYTLWLRLVEDHQPLVVNDQFTVFIINKNSSTTGNIFRFTRTVLLAFVVQKQEKVFPFIGTYDDRKFYKNYKNWLLKSKSFGQFLASSIKAWKN